MTHNPHHSHNLSHRSPNHKSKHPPGEAREAPSYLPLTLDEAKRRGWNEVDFVLVTGDAYVDHPSFGAALIGRLLESRGYRVGILAQPDWRNPASFRQFGRPALAFLVTSGNLDSMLSNYTPAGKPRNRDAYSPGGIGGKRPDRAAIVYANRCREAYRGIPIVLGGIEASLRRFAHYDFWSKSVRRSILFDSRADLLVYGMAEQQILRIAEGLRSGQAMAELHRIPGTAYIASSLDEVQCPNGKEPLEIPSFDEVTGDRKSFARAFLMQEKEQNPYAGRTIVQRHSDRFLVQNPPAIPLSEQEMDDVYALSFRREAHPSYEPMGGVPGLEEVQFSITSHRGCFGGCSFCALTFHQGKIIQARSHDSILAESSLLTEHRNFKGYIHDVGGPTANFRAPACDRMETKGACNNRLCMFPEPCKKLHADHRDLITLLRKIRALPGIKKVFIRSGIRFDYMLADPSDSFLEELCEHHVSGQLKVAPEHASSRVLSLMGKPGIAVYEEFRRRFQNTNRKIAKEQYLVPYLMSGHPGSGLKEAIELAEKIRDWGYNPEQVQDFVPTPGSLSTCMYYTKLDPRTMEPVYVPESSEEKNMQRALLQFRNPANHAIVRKALRMAGREDLIGSRPGCLVPAGGPSGGDRQPQRLESGPAKSARREAVGRAKGSRGRKRDKVKKIHKNIK